MVIVAFCLLWVRYGFRVMAIARTFEDMPPGEKPEKGPKRLFDRRRW